MKKVILLFTVIAFVSCKSDKKTEEQNITIEDSEKTEAQNDGLTLLKGEFIYYTSPEDKVGAAVLQTTKEMYGVIVDDKMHELNKLVQQYKKVDTDMIPVEVRGEISDKENKNIHWKYKFKIVEIINVSKPNPEGGEIITIGKE